MAKLIIDGNLTVLSSKVVKTLANRSCGTEDIASRCCTTKDSIRKMLSRLKHRDLVEHDGRRPRTWALKGQLAEASTTGQFLLGRDIQARISAQLGGRVRFDGCGMLPPEVHAAKRKKEAA